MGFDKNSEEMLTSILQIGTGIPTWPQLGGTATIAGGVIATTIKKIVLDEKINSGRYFISLDDILVDNFNDPKRQLKRESLINIIEKNLKMRST